MGKKNWIEFDNQEKNAEEITKVETFHKNSNINISKHNKYLAEMTGIYWVYKNQINKFKNDDWIGFCHYRRFWLNGFYNQNHKLYVMQK